MFPPHTTTTHAISGMWQQQQQWRKSDAPSDGHESGSLKEKQNQCATVKASFLH